MAHPLQSKAVPSVEPTHSNCTPVRSRDFLCCVTVFRYDSLGFPADLTCLVAKQAGWGVDMKGFDAAMQQQRERARLHWSGSGDSQLPADVRCAFGTYLKCRPLASFALVFVMATFATQ